MKFVQVIGFFLLLMFPLFSSAQEKKPPVIQQEEVPGGIPQEKPMEDEAPVEATPERRPPAEPEMAEDAKELKKREKAARKNAKKEKGKKAGPALVAVHTKSKTQRYFYIGETIKYQRKTDKKRDKGVIVALKGDKVTIDSTEVKVTDLILVGKKFGRTWGWRTAGLSKFAIGTGIALAGTALIIVGADAYSVENSQVVWGTLGVVVGTGTALVGAHFMIQGGKGLFQNSTKKSKRGWKFKIQ